MQEKLMLILMGLVMLSLPSCSGVGDLQPTVTTGIDLCQSGIEPFSLTDGEVLKHNNLKNMAKVNVLLATKCGQAVPNAKAVKAISYK